MSVKAVRNIREPLKKPRPLKSSVNTVEQSKSQTFDPKELITQKSRDALIDDLEILNVSISNCSFDDVTIADISRMCIILKRRGEELDSTNKDEMDHYFRTIRNASREEKLDMLSRLKLVEVIEARARGWKKNENIDSYFNMKISELEQMNLNSLNHSLSLSNVSFLTQNPESQAPSIPLQHGEILRSSGKFSKPTKIAGKNYFKDEIVIRNSDSGKVNPGARDRLVQITGPHEEAIGHAKLLVEDTIRRNASPMRETESLSVFEGKDMDANRSYSPIDNQAYGKKPIQHSYSMSDASLKEHSFPVQIGQDFITLSGTNVELIKTAKLVLKEYFSSQSEMFAKQDLVRRMSSPDNVPRYGLSRQSSLRGNMDRNFSSNWTNNRRHDSVSTLSSSDDDILKEDGRLATSLSRSSPDSLSNSNVKKLSSVSSEMSTTEDKVSTSSTVSKLSKMSFSDIPPSSTDEVFSPLPQSPEMDINPPIPPPLYKYNRDFLLKCAKSPFSHSQPLDYALIHQNYEQIIAQAPSMFDPDEYERSQDMYMSKD